MFEVTKKEFVNKSFRVNKDLIAELEVFAAVNHISLNELVVQCCRYALNNCGTSSIEPSE